MNIIMKKINLEELKPALEQWATSASKWTGIEAKAIYRDLEREYLETGQYMHALRQYSATGGEK